MSVNTWNLFLRMLATKQPSQFTNTAEDCIVKWVHKQVSSNKVHPDYFWGLSTGAFVQREDCDKEKLYWVFVQFIVPLFWQDTFSSWKRKRWIDFPTAHYTDFSCNLLLRCFGGTHFPDGKGNNELIFLSQHERWECRIPLEWNPFISLHAKELDHFTRMTSIVSEPILSVQMPSPPLWMASI